MGCASHRHSPISTDDSANPTDLKNPIDINHASEDEFLLLPGITRELAKRIVRYRQRLNGFQNVDQVLQIDGFNTDLFRRLRSELSVNVARPKSTPTLINLNVATYDQLCSSPSVTPLLANKILQIREQKGTFRNFDDLSDIQGMDETILTGIRSRFSIDEIRSTDHSLSDKSQSEKLKKNSSLTTFDALNLAATFLATLPQDLEKLVLKSSSEKLIVQMPTVSSSFRFCTWNLQNLSVEKLQNPGVHHVITRVALTNNFRLIAIQDAVSKEAVDQLIQDLNRPLNSSLKEISRTLGKTWKSIGVSCIEEGHYSAFIYDESLNVQLDRSNSIPSSIVVRIRDGLDLVFINVLLSSTASSRTETSTFLSNIINGNATDRKRGYTIIVGSFNQAPTSPEFDSFRTAKFSNLIQHNTDISLDALEGSLCADHIWLSSKVKRLSTGFSGVIRQDLNHLLIPNGWRLGGLVSNHCPVWAELSLAS